VLAELVDMYPTIASLAHTARPSDELDGTDISAIFDDPTKHDLKPAAFTQYPRCPQKGKPAWENNGCGPSATDGFMGMTIRTGMRLVC
jgi:arylsulfatase A-like enzyme